MAKDAALAGLQRTQTRTTKGVKVDEDALTPPDDFRTVSVFPTREDLNKVIITKMIFELDNCNEEPDTFY